MILGWLIKDNRGEYYSIDQNSGGYPCWTSILGRAEVFHDKDTAISTVETDPCFYKCVEMSDGTIYPPYMIHISAKINHKSTTGEATIYVVPLIIEEPIMSKKFIGKIIRKAT